MCDFGEGLLNLIFTKRWATNPYIRIFDRETSCEINVEQIQVNPQKIEDNSNPWKKSGVMD
jgi:hypothetical protein